MVAARGCNPFAVDDESKRENFAARSKIREGTRTDCPLPVCIQFLNENEFMSLTLQALAYPPLTYAGLRPTLQEFNSYMIRKGNTKM